MKDILQKTVQIAKKYPFSTCCIVLIWILSFLPFPEMESLEDVPFVDKWTHVVMYGGTCCVIWMEYIRKHVSLDAEKLFFFAWLLPIVMSGVIELLQEYCTGGRRNGDLLDLAANATGVTVAALIGLCLLLLFPRR
jgi:VanZ family protein